MHVCVISGNPVAMTTLGVACCPKTMTEVLWRGGAEEPYKLKKHSTATAMLYLHTYTIKLIDHFAVYDEGGDEFNT